MLSVFKIMLYIVPYEYINQAIKFNIRSSQIVIIVDTARSRETQSCGDTQNVYFYLYNTLAFITLVALNLNFDANDDLFFHLINFTITNTFSRQ